jgi:hypothetical protein
MKFRVEVKDYEKGYKSLTMYVVDENIDRDRVHGIVVGNKYVERVKKAMEDGAIYRSYEIKTDVNGNTYVSGDGLRIIGRYIPSSLKEMGY